MNVSPEGEVLLSAMACADPKMDWKTSSEWAGVVAVKVVDGAAI